MKQQESEFHQALQCAAGAAAHEEGRPITEMPLEEYSAWFNKASKAWSDQKTWAFRFSPSPEDWDLWRLGWLWAHYESWEKRRPGHEWHRFDYRALDAKVLVVASLNLPLGKWCAYISAVPGLYYENEWLDVAMYGTKLPEDVAAKIFPEFARQFEYEK